MPGEKTDRSRPQTVPAGRIGRLARFAAITTRTGHNIITGGDVDACTEANARALGKMRGLAAKLGQMTAYVDGVVPDERQESCERHMRQLLDSAPISAPEAIRAVVEDELGEPVESLFAVWDDQPIASASIGQVHRAILHDGRHVAVKVQHPMIAAAVEADLKNIGVFETFISVVGSRRADSKRVFGEVQTRFREELDYRIEAEHQERFRRIHAGDSKVIIPAVIRERSSERVLTSELVGGMGFADACAAPPEQRAEWCRTLWRYVYRGNLIGGYFNADPHPGNYLFQPGGAIAFLDYGCVQPLSEERRVVARGAHEAAVAGDEERFQEAAKRLLETRGGTYERNATAYLRRCFEPMFAPTYRIRRSFVAALFSQFRTIAAAAARNNDASFELPAGVFFLNRLQFGFYSVLARLDVEVDYQTVEHEILDLLALKKSA